MSVKGRSKWVVTREFLQKEYVENDKGIVEVGKLIGCSSNHVRKLCLLHGIEPRRAGRRRTLDKVLTKEFFEEHYIKLKKSRHQIARETGHHLRTVAYYLTKHFGDCENGPGAEGTPRASTHQR